jgi:hypothetical protein
MRKLPQIILAGVATIGAVVIACNGGTGGGGWDRVGWFGEEATGTHDAGVFIDAASLGHAPPSGSAQPKKPSCGTIDCTGTEVCVPGVGDAGPTCAPTCIAGIGCSSGCCATMTNNHGQDVMYCAPAEVCCGNTGASCKSNQACVSQVGGAACSDRCTTSSDCTITLCCGVLPNDGGTACMQLGQAKACL